MTNADLAKSVIKSLEGLGVRTFCICPGARNSPLVECLTNQKQNHTLFFFDERSAGFFAAGRIRSSGSPVAVITTSGTAVGELLPAVMEAFYSGLPLILVTADRPKRFRGTGAPQSAEQEGIFGVYVQKSVDLSVGSESLAFSWDSQVPLQINICFDEPLIDQHSGKSLTVDIVKLINPTQKESGKEFEEFLKNHKFPLFLISGLTKSESHLVSKFLDSTKFLFYAEGPSQLRELPQLESSQLFNLDKIHERSVTYGYPIDCVIRIGDVPTHRLWRDLESKTKWPVFSLSPKKFSGLPNSRFHQIDFEVIFKQVTIHQYDSQKYNLLKSEDESRLKNIRTLLKVESQSEPGIFNQISSLVEQNQFVYLGNSLPIREWDLAAGYDYKNLTCYGSRGLNGIDGQLSYFFGSLVPGKSSLAIIGDLTALYDLQAPWILKQLSQSDFKIIIINNGGGKIFQRMYEKKEYLNSHNLKFKGWAEMFGLTYTCIDGEGIENINTAVTEIIPSASSTERFWEQYDRL